MPLFLTIWIARASKLASRLLGRGAGSALPGLVAERLDSAILTKLAQNLKGTVLITGTNGKTSTTHMLVSTLEAAGQSVVTNPSGSNLTRGLIAGLIDRADWLGRVPHQLAVFEVDEAATPAAIQALRPRLVLVLNLFRDQLDRYGELDSIAKALSRSMEQSNATVLLNADDPLVVSLGDQLPAERVRYFGMEAAEQRRLPHDWAADSDRCTVCGEALEYSINFFSHIGHWHCRQGHTRRPQPQLSGRLTGDRLELSDGRKLQLALPGLYNAYNALAVASAAQFLEIDPALVIRVLSETKAVFGRAETFQYQGRQLTLLLIKNPTGFNQVIQTFLQQPVGALMIAINDNFADGRDVSWLWDVAFEELPPAQPIIASGVRASDLALRLKYADRVAQVEPDLVKAVQQALKGLPAGGSLYILPTYTAMLQLRQGLKLPRFQA